MRTETDKKVQGRLGWRHSCLRRGFYDCEFKCGEKKQKGGCSSSNISRSEVSMSLQLRGSFGRWINVSTFLTLKQEEFNFPFKDVHVS